MNQKNGFLLMTQQLMGVWREIFNNALVPHFFTPIIIACGRFCELVTSVDKIQIIISTKIIPLRQLK